MLRNWEFKLGIGIALYYLLHHFLFASPESHDTNLSAHLRIIPEQFLNQWATLHSHVQDEKYAYVQYATTYGHINLAILNGIDLRKVGTKADIVVIIDEKLQTFDHDQWNKVYNLAQTHGIKLKPYDVITSDVTDDVWRNLFTKLYAFDMTEYSRVVYFDGDLMIMDSNMDELFSIPSEIEFALPHAYWHNHVLENYHLNEGMGHVKPRPNVNVPKLVDYQKRIDGKTRLLTGDDSDWRLLPLLEYDGQKYGNRLDFFATHIMVITPNHQRFKLIMLYVNTPWYWRFIGKGSLAHRRDEYDMEVVNKYLDDQLKNGDSFKMGVLPHDVYGVLSGEFLEDYHRRFVVPPQYTPFIEKNTNEEWDASEAMSNIKLVHFSDAPIPKPWEVYDDQMPYNTKRIFCLFDYDEKLFTQAFPVYKPRVIDDCEAVEAWESIRLRFDKRMANWVV